MQQEDAARIFWKRKRVSETVTIEKQWAPNSYSEFMTRIFIYTFVLRSWFGCSFFFLVFLFSYSLISLALTNKWITCNVLLISLNKIRAHKWHYREKIYSYTQRIEFGHISWIHDRSLSSIFGHAQARRTVMMWRGRVATTRVQLICTWTRWSYVCRGYMCWQHVYAAWNTGMMRVLGNMLYHQHIFISRPGTNMHGACMNLANRQWGYSTILAVRCTGRRRRRTHVRIRANWSRHEAAMETQTLTCYSCWCRFKRSS
jgi:hypothetical protein